ncbi:cell division control protein 25 [Coprinopsis sp. MPI-PUGE-AT-0042]|nr:cell division control protein 25 [Coprinopsis sp. MPI-PUGE-AT-0042]
MYSRLAIDTTTGNISGPRPRYGRAVSPAGPKLPTHRGRSLSNASTASSLSIISPSSSSTNASSTSLALPGTSSRPSSRSRSRSRSVSTSRSVSPSVEEEARLNGERVVALHDYNPEYGNGTDTLSFHTGQIIHVLNRDPSGWWDGEIDGKRGWFPSNYVSADLSHFRDEDPEETISLQHRANSSTSSLTSCEASSSSSHHHNNHNRSESTSATTSEESESYCSPLMVPLLQGLSLLQNAVRAKRLSHYQPATACIISYVRAILSATGTLQRDEPILLQHPHLADERKRILTILASLVAQSKKASDETIRDATQNEDTAGMIRLAGQVFAHVRRFLTVAENCGVQLPNEFDSSIAQWAQERTPNVRPDSPPNAGQTPMQEKASRRQLKPAPLHMKSQSDLRGRSRSPLPPTGSQTAKPKSSNQMSLERRNAAVRRKHQANDSISSFSSISSMSSMASSSSLSPPPFPNGPSTTAQVLEALRDTHDNYLSTIAAFIGHAHSHSRTSHASSTGQLYDLLQEIVELVCKLLVIVDAVRNHPDVPSHRIDSLRLAKDGLFDLTSSLTQSVRLLTAPTASKLSEEDEKKALLQSATNALKAGADCVASVKVCLTRSTSDRPFVIGLPDVKELTLPFTPHKPQDHAKNGYHLNGMDDEDLTIQAISPSPVQRRRSPPPRPRDVSSGSLESNHTRNPSWQPSTAHGSRPSTAEGGKRPPHGLAPLRLLPKTPVEPDLGSPTSVLRSDDGTTWEGSVREHPHALRPGQRPPVYYHDTSPGIPNEQILDVPVDPMSWMHSHDYAMEDVAYNNEGHLVGATMAALVEKMTPHDVLVDPAFSAVFFLTFRLFSSPSELVDTIIARYNLTPPPGISREDEQLWQQQKGIPVRLRVSNFVKTWLDTYWRTGVDEPALKPLTLFTKEGLALFFPGPAQRIMDLLNQRRQSEVAVSPIGDRSRDPGMLINPPVLPALTEMPRPTMTKSLFGLLKKKDFTGITITDFDALELARQLTVMECDLYCAIQPTEVLETGQEGAAPPLNVRAVSSLSTVITGWVAESILDELDLKKRTLLVKFFVKVADRCVTLQNFSTSRSILAALDSSTISRLRQTWAGLQPKYKALLESLRKLADHGRNYHEYRSRLRNTAPPAVPFLGLYLTDVTFCREGNPSHRPSPMDPNKKLINFNKYHKLARIVQDMQRFQVPYCLKPIPEVQMYLNIGFERARKHGDLQDLYNRSLLVEPKQAADADRTHDMRQFFNWARSQPNVGSN